MTTAGVDTIAYLLREDAMTRDSAADAVAASSSPGNRWFDAFGPDGDWGVKADGWGMAYLSPQWLLAHATPPWACRLFRGGALLRSQDFIVLERRD